MEEEEQKKETNSRIDPADVIIAKRLYRKRCFLGYSQKDLADCTGVSIQQIQKYEKSTNRISAGRLYRFAKFLNISINYFFDNMEAELAKYAKESKMPAFAEEQEMFFPELDPSTVSEKEVITLVKFYNGIKDYSVRKKFVDLIRAVSSINYT